MDKSSSSKSLLSVQTIVLAEIAWAVLALLFFLLFSVPLPGQGRPVWYSIGTSIFEACAYLVATLLCFRNWASPQIVSGRNVWLCIGLGMLCYFIGNLIFSWWEIGFQLEPDVSLADFFFVPTYIFLIAGMILAVASRRLNLEIWQWGVVGAIAAIGIAVASWVSFPANSTAPRALLIQPVAAQTAPANASSHPFKLAAKANPPAAAKPTKAPASPSPASGTVAPSPATTDQKLPPPVVPSGQKAPAAAETHKAPQWAVDLGETLKPLKVYFDWFYVISDLLLLVIATTLLLAFWGGRFAQSWRMIAAAAFSLYIADIWFKYATNRLTDYQSGGLLEVFWVFSGVLFGVGAALEHDLSSRSRSRSGGRRRAT